MPIEIVVPQLGESVVEGTIGKWLKNEGDSVKRDEPLLEIQTDKINMEIPCPGTGILAKILAKEGTVVPVGALLGVILEEGETEADVTKKAAAAPAFEPERRPIEFGKPAEAAVATDFPAPPMKETAGPAAGLGNLSPAVRRLAREHEIDLTRVKGTGAGGRITRKDVLAFIESGGAVTAGPAVPKPSVIPSVDEILTPEDEIIPLEGVRKIISEHMVASKRISPHVTTFDEVDFTEIVNFRNKYKQEIREKEGVNLTFMPFIIKACCHALKEFPYVNASMTDREIILKKSYHIGVAVARDEGLIVPVIHHADRKSLIDLARELADKAERARQEKLLLSEIHGSTFTITNAGGYGAVMSTPIINQPEVAILGVHNIIQRPVVRDGEIVIRWISYFGLSFDHRLVDGHVAVQFLRKVADYLENPEKLFLMAI